MLCQWWNRECGNHALPRLQSQRSLFSELFGDFLNVICEGGVYGCGEEGEGVACCC